MLVTELEVHRAESVEHGIRIEKSRQLSEMLSQNKLHSPFVLRFGNSINILHILDELLAVLRAYLLKENVEILESPDLDLIYLVLQEPFHDGYQISFSDLSSKDSSQLMDRVSESPFDSAIIKLGELQIDFAEVLPSVLP